MSVAHTRVLRSVTLKWTEMKVALVPISVGMNIVPSADGYVVLLYYLQSLASNGNPAMVAVQQTAHGKCGSVYVLR